ncbi:hypothetical protein CCACVL1_12043, partial [Corchorus capsularis]
AEQIQPKQYQAAAQMVSKG